MNDREWSLRSGTLESNVEGFDLLRGDKLRDAIASLPDYDPLKQAVAELGRQPTGSAKGEWRPIESCDKNAGPFLLASSHGHVLTGRWNSHIEGWTTEAGTFHRGTTVGGEPCRITHWMPFPEPPAQGMQLREDSRSEAEAVGLQPGPAQPDAPE